MTGQLPPDVVRRGRSGGWAPALRIARRELLRAKGRTLLVLLMVLLPLTAVVGLDTLLRTAELSAEETLPRELGTAQARVDPQYGAVQQSPDLSRSGSVGGDREVVLTPSQVAAVLDPAAVVVPVRTTGGEVPARTPDGRTARVALVGVDLRDAALRGPYTLLRGRAPATADEVAVTPQVERFGFPAGSSVLLPGGVRRTVVGTVLYPLSYGAVRAVVGLPEAVGLASARPGRFYVAGAAVSWDDVLQLNALGAAVLSRSVVLDPPPGDQVPDVPGYDGQDATTAAVVALIAVIAVLEVVLLAGPAFAVGARRQRRALALMAAGGAEPRHVRRVVLAQGVLVGGTAAVLAVVLGVGGAALARGPLTRFAGAGWGPFQVSVRDVALLCLLGAGTALLAALAPAVLAARQPVVAALQGRRTTSGRPWRLSALGGVLLVLGVLACYRSVSRQIVDTEFWVAVSAVPTVLGAAALAPALLHLTGRAAGRLPLALRFAVRDADRQRGRTAPAVAAVTGVVAGVVALATAAGSDASSYRTTARPGPLAASAVVQVYGPGADYPALAAAARRALPGERTLVVQGVALPSSGTTSRQVLVCRPGDPAGAACPGFSPDGTGSGTGVLGSSAVVGASGLDVVLPGLSPADADAARAALQAGRALVPGAPAGARVEVRLVDQRYDPASGRDTSLLVRSTTLVAEPLPLRAGRSPVAVVLPDAAAPALGGSAPVSLVVGGTVDDGERRRLEAALQRVDTGATVYVEQTDGSRDDERLVVLLLFLAAGFLVLAGSLAATSLALTEARPDLATMGQVGARPRTRRLVAAAYAFVLALVGAALGCAAGLVPGVAGAVAITRDGSYAATPGQAVLYSDAPTALSRVDVPWLLLLGLLVVLPLLTAAVAGLSVRSALPGVGRRVRA